MSRLSKYTRESMARKLVNHRYEDEAKEILYTGRRLFEAAYNHCYSDTLVGAMEVVQKEFRSHFEFDNHMRVNAGGFDVELGGRFYSRWVTIPQTEDEDRNRLLVSTYDRHSITDPELIEQIKDYATRKSGFDDVCKEAYHEALSVLNTFTTGKRLAEGWPEAMSVIGSLIPESQRTLPVVQVASVNNKFKLPPETADA